MNKRMQKAVDVEQFPLFLTPEQASRVSGIGVNYIRDLMKEGRLEHLAVGKRRLIHISSLLNYYEREKVPTVQAPKDSM